MHKFSDVFEFHKKSKIKAGDGKPEGKYPFYTSSTELNKYVDDYLFNGKSLVFGTGGNASVHFAKNKFAVSTDCLVAQANTKDINPKFVYYYLSGNIHILEQGFKGAGLKHISKTYISEVTFPKFSRKKQDEIVQTFDTADNLRQKREEQLALLDDYLKSVFLEMFGDKEKFQKCKIREIAANRKYSLSSGPFGSNLTSKDYVKEGVIVLRGLNVSRGILDVSKVKYITESKASELRRSEVVPNDIVIIAVGSSGLALRIPKTLPRSIMSQNFNKISPNTDKINPLFMQYFMNSDFVQNQFRKKITDTVRTFLSLTKIKDVEIILPPIELQNKFVLIVDCVEKIKQKMRDSLNEMDNHFNALMQRYFG